MCARRKHSELEQEYDPSLSFITDLERQMHGKVSKNILFINNQYFNNPNNISPKPSVIKQPTGPLNKRPNEKEKIEPVEVAKEELQKESVFDTDNTLSILNAAAAPLNVLVSSECTHHYTELLLLLMIKCNMCFSELKDDKSLLGDILMRDVFAIEICKHQSISKDHDDSLMRQFPHVLRICVVLEIESGGTCKAAITKAKHKRVDSYTYACDIILDFIEEIKSKSKERSQHK